MEAPVPQSTKILTTNFQKKESQKNTKYMAISFEKSSTSQTP